MVLFTGAKCPPPTEDRPALCTGIEVVFGPLPSWMSGFFVLAGFVITWTWSRGRLKRKFWQGRFAKIYPLFFASVMVDLVLLSLAIPGASASVRPFPPIEVILINLLMLQTWTPDLSLSHAIHPVIWTLCAIAFCYLAFPYLRAWFDRVGTPMLRVLFGALLFWPLLLMGALYVIDKEGFQQLNILGWLLYHFPGNWISHFALGMVSALLVKRGAWIGLRVQIAIPLTLAAYGVGIVAIPYMGPLGAPMYAMVMAPFFAILMVSLARADMTGGWSPLRGKFIVAMGMTAFSFYLTHPFIVTPLGFYVLSWDSSWKIVANTVIFIVISAPVGWVVYKWYELPMQRLLRPKDRATDKDVSKATTTT